VATTGAEANGQSQQPTISGDGRFVAFTSDATNLSANDSNGSWDVFVRDRQNGTTTLVSQSSTGEKGNGGGSTPKISADGRYVAFWSGADNLVADDTNGIGDVFVRDLSAGTTRRVSVETNGIYEDSGAESCCFAISSNGRFVVFSSRIPDQHAYLRDLLTETTTQVDLYSDGVDRSGLAAGISADGRFALIAANPSFLPPDYDDAGGALYVRDRQLATTTLVSDISAGFELPPDTDGGLSDASISGDGRYVAFSVPYREDDTGYMFSLGAFVHDRRTGITKQEYVSTAAAPGEQGGAEHSSLSSDSRFLVFSSSSNNLVEEPTAALAAFILELPHVPEVSLSPASLDFGNIARGTVSPGKKVTIKNTGPVPLPIAEIKVAGSNPGQFSQTNNCPDQLPVSGKCTATVIFKPTTTGPKSAILRVTPGGGGKVQSAALTGTGI
jgi:Tol biopolymer transport system component